MMLPNMLTGKNSGCEGESNSDNTAEVRTRLTMQRVRLEQVGQNQLLLSANIWKLEFVA